MGIKFHFKWRRPVSPCVSADVAEDCFLYSIFRVAHPLHLALYSGVNPKNDGLKKLPPKTSSRKIIFRPMNLKKIEMKK